MFVALAREQNWDIVGATIGRPYVGFLPFVADDR